MRGIGAIGLTAALVALGSWAWVALTPAGQPPRPSPRPLSEFEQAALPDTFRTLLPLHRTLADPRPGEWLDRHQEAGENYRQYTASRPVRVRPERRTIYVQPLGEFTPDQRRIVTSAAEFLGHAFQLPVRVRDDLPLSLVSPEARRIHPQWGMPQIHAPFVCDRILKPRLPDDAVAYIGLTASDLWPDENSNFVFGQASLSDRIGIWSMYRFGDPRDGEAAFRLTLLRTLKLAVHETGHMFSLAHCVHFDCVMNGVNHLAESDSRPLAFCPQCLAKIVYATDADPGRHFTDCARFAEAAGLEAERAFWRRSLEALEGTARR